LGSVGVLEFVNGMWRRRSVLVTKIIIVTQQRPLSPTNHRNRGHCWFPVPLVV
jgi:hypothetical protein